MCPPPGRLENGYLLPIYGLREALVSVNYQCRPPFILTGSQQRTCLPNGTWSGAVPICVEGTFSPSRCWSSFLMFIQRKCDIMRLFMIFFPLFSPKCTHTGQTSRVQCAPLSKLLNGYHRPALNTAAGAETIEFFCKNSYILSGKHQSTCLSNGSWSSRPPTCVRGSRFQKHIRAGNTL